MKTARKSEKKSAEGDSIRVDAYVGRNALRKCGGVYVISRCDGLVKVGITEGDFSRRFKEVEQASRSAGIVGIQPEILVPMDEGMAEVEAAVHKRLSKSREGGEWFRMSAADAVDAVLLAILRQRRRNAEGRDLIEAGTAGTAGRRKFAEALNLEEVVNAALLAAQTIDDPQFRVNALCGVAQAQADAADKQTARKTIKSAMSAAMSIDKPGNERVLALCVVALTQAGMGDVEPAVETARKIGDENARVLVLDVIPSASTKMKENDTPASKLTPSMVLEGAKAGILQDWQRMRHEQALAQAEAGDVDGALATARSIDSAEARARSLCAVRTKAGNFDGALAAARDIGNEWRRSNALLDIALARTKTGDIDGASAVARGIDDERCRSDALCDIALAQAEAGDIGGALATARSIDSEETRAWALCAAQAEAGNLDNALDAAQDIDDELDLFDALGHIALAQWRAGNMGDALATARGIGDEFYRDLALRDISSAQTKAGNFQDAMKITMEIGNPEDRCDALMNIAKGLAAERSG